MRGERTCTSAHADTRMLDATRSQGITSYTLWGSWHVKRAIPAQMHQSLTKFCIGTVELAQSLHEWECSIEQLCLIAAEAPYAILSLHAHTLAYTHSLALLSQSVFFNICCAQQTAGQETVAARLCRVRDIC